MAVSRAERRAARRDRVVAVFGEHRAEAALDLLEITEFAWHDCYDEITPSENFVDEMLLCSGGDLSTLIEVARLAVTDWRDVKLWAQAIHDQADGG